MIRDPNHPEPEEGFVPRLFLREPGWKIARKPGSDREFCYSMAPGQNAYHRLSDGELYVYSGEEKLCLPCADRRGLLQYDPKPLRAPVRGLDVSGPNDPEDTIPVVEPREE